ncbi:MULTISPECIES: DNA polymerase III subunit beta [Oceanimonas]|uniref:Beta sliding clamp n=1 Tax=Oceanimonas smirnovii TaxID=264574 RepID=A0ABW7P3Z4_9GAMM|nr:DNA polymerase III subunit beta [Oceanimonas sp. CAM02]MDV2856631.1 DNA polymerase III subunit beta [Oceanimonas sp. CAM02]
MQFTISREALLRPLQLVSSALGGRPNLPILNNILLSVDNDALSMTGTDTEVEMVARVPLEGSVTAGRTTVPARKMLDICRGLPDGAELSFSQQDDRLLLRSGRSRFNLSTLPAEDFPNIEEWSSELEFDINQLALKKLIEATQFSMAIQDVRYYLNGMLFETDGNSLRTVATDGHRLATCQRELEQALPAQQVIVPRKGVLELAKLLEHEDQDVRLQVGKNNLRAVTQGFTFTSKLVDGRFPDYRRVLPRESDKTLICDREGLKQAFTRAAILSNEKFRGVRLNVQGQTLKITANNPEQEEAEEVLDVHFEGSDLEIGFNVSYVLDVLGTLKSEQVKISLKDASSSGLIEAEDNSDALYVVMPMRL